MKKRSDHLSKDDKAAWHEYKIVFEKYGIDKRLFKPETKVRTKSDEMDGELYSSN